MTSFSYSTWRKVLRMRRKKDKTKLKDSDIGMFWFNQETSGRPVWPEWNVEMKMVGRNEKGAKGRKY